MVDGRPIMCSKLYSQESDSSLPDAGGPIFSMMAHCFPGKQCWFCVHERQLLMLKTKDNNKPRKVLALENHAANRSYSHGCTL